MTIKNKEYKLKMGLRALRLLKEEFNKDATGMEFDTVAVVQLMYCGLKAYNKDFKHTLEDVEDALDEDLSGFKTAQDEIVNFFNRYAEAFSEAKN